MAKKTKPKAEKSGRLAAAIDIGQAIARSLFCAMADPAMRGPKFRWPKLPRMAGDSARASTAMHLPAPTTDREIEVSEAAARNEAHRLLNERKKKVLSDATIARLLDANGHLPLHAVRIAELEAAIRKHRDAKGHDLCWENDADLWRVLGEDLPSDRKLPPRDEFLGNCEEYYELCRAREDEAKGIKPLEKIVYDTCYELDRPLLEGAEAFLKDIPYTENPYHQDSQSYAQWEYGHELASADEGPEQLTKAEIKAAWKALGRVEAKKRPKKLPLAGRGRK